MAEITQEKQKIALFPLWSHTEKKRRKTAYLYFDR